MASGPKGWSSRHFLAKEKPTSLVEYQNACQDKGRVDVINVRSERHTDASTVEVLTDDSNLADPANIFDKETMEHHSMEEIMSETTTTTLQGSYFKEIHEFVLLLAKNPSTAGRVEVQMSEECVHIKGPFVLVGKVREWFLKGLARAIKQGKMPLSEIISDVIEESDDESTPNQATDSSVQLERSFSRMDDLDPDVIRLMKKNRCLEDLHLSFSPDNTEVSAVDESNNESMATFVDLYSKTSRSLVKEAFHFPTRIDRSIILRRLAAVFPMVLFIPHEDDNCGVSLLSLERPTLPSVVEYCNSHSWLDPPVSSDNEPYIVIQLPHKGTLTIKKGDLVKEEVSAIVNAANERLQHIGGVAFAIDKASHWKVQKASNQALNQLRLPKIPTGQALLTSAGGNLKCRAVIHAVGPDAAVFTPEQCTALLHQACEQSLRLAEENKMTSVAFPPISSGIYGVDATVVAQVLIDTICQYKYWSNSTLVDVRIVVIDGKTLQPFLDYGAHVAYMQSSLPTPDPTQSPQQPGARGRSPQPGPGRNSSSHQSNPTNDDQMSHEMLVPLAKNHRKVVLKKGNMLYTNADIKIVAISSPEGFKTGNNASLNRVLDGFLQQTVDRRYQSNMPDKYDVFTVHCPPNSKANSRFLVVANILDHNLGSCSDAPKFLQQILHSVCREADTLEMPTAAIAPGSFDCGGFPKDSILPAFIKMLNEYNFTNDEFLTEVSVLAMSDADFSVFVQSAERAVGQTLLRLKDHTPSASVPTPDNARLSQQPSADGMSPQAAQTGNSFSHQNEPAFDDQVQVPLAKSHRKLVVSKGNILYGNTDIKIVAISSTEGFNEVGNNASLDRALDGLLQQTVNRRYQSSRPDKYDVFTVHCPPSSKVNCRFLVVANILDRNLGSCSDAPKFLQQILHSVCKEADTLEMPTAAIAPGTFDCGGFSKDSILPAFVKMLNEYNFTNKEFLTEVSVVAVSDDDFSVLVQSAERAVGQPLLRLKDHTPSADDKSPQAVQTRSSLPHQNEPVADDQMSHESHQVPVPLAKSHRKLVVSKGNILYANVDIKVVAISSPEGFNVGNNASLDRVLDGLLQQTVMRRYQSSRPDKYDVFTVHCPPNCKVNCRFLVVTNILVHNLGSHSDAPKYLQQIFHSICREADTLEMPTAAIAPATFSCGGFPKDSILPAFIRMLNEYNFTNDEFLTEVSVLAMSDDDFSVLVQSAERAVGQPLLQPRNHPPRPPSQPFEDNSATGSSFVGQVFNALSSLNPFRSGSSNCKVQNEPPPQHTHNIPSTPVHQPAHCSSITMGSKCTLSVKFSDILEDAVDAIVNPTNGNLDLISGISSALNKASRGAVKRECTDLVSRRGEPVPPGCVAVTESGRQLKSKWIIHVNVYDTEESSIQGYSQLLSKSLANVLEVAENRHLSSVALAPFFPRTYRLELTSEMVAHYFINAIVHCSFPEQSSLKELRLFADDKESFVAFQKALQTVSSMITATLPHPDGQSHASQVQPSRTELNSRNVVQSPSTEPDVFEIPTQSSRRRLVVKKSRFLNEVADIKIVAICSEDHKHSPLKNLNKTLNGALVESITSRYQHGKPSQFDVFTVHCPPDATLQCRFLVVVNILDRKLGQGADSHKHLNQILHNVCREADTLEMPTVAIASGTFDIGGFARESILLAFVRMITQYNFTNDDFLTDVKFLTSSDNAFASMCADVKRSFGTLEGKLDARSPPSPVSSPTHGPHCSPSFYHGRDVPNVQVVFGDIVAFLADAVVVPVSPALDLKGCVSEDVNNATHDQLRRKVKNLKINDGDVVAYEKSKFVAGQWKIKAHHLYLLCRSKNTQVDTLKKALAFVLDEATFHKLKSIAFPIPFLSKRVSKTSTADFAMALKDVVTLHQATNPQAAIVVTVVVSKSEPPAVLKSLQESFWNPVTTSSDSIDTEV